MIRFPFALALICLSNTLSGSAFGGDDAHALLSRLERKYDAMRDATLSFRQDVRYGVTKAEQSFQGKLLIKKKNRYRIELEDQTIVTNGRVVWSYTKSNQQVIVDNYKDDPRSFTPDKVLVNLPDRYTATVLGKDRLQNRPVVVLKLIPKDRKSRFSWMKLWVDENEELMRQVQILDMSENLTTYVIDTLRVNSGLADSQFEYQAPPGVEVIDLR